MSADPVARTEELLQRLFEAGVGYEAEEASAEIQSLMDDDGVRKFLINRREEIYARLKEASGQAATAGAHQLLLSLSLAYWGGMTLNTTSVETASMADVPSSVRGPASERMMAALLLLETAHAQIPMDDDSIEGACDRLRDYSGGGIESAFKMLVDLLRTASYYVMHVDEAAAALSSEPPQMPTFPPLPFPRVWIETHDPYNLPNPIVRLVPTGDDSEASELADPHALDLFGIGISEVVPGHLWDVVIPFSSSTKGWASLAFRMSPTEIVHIIGLAEPDDIERMTNVLQPAFATLSQIVIGSVHLISAKNVPHDHIVLPRHQRKRLGNAELVPSLSRIYYVNLRQSGEHEPAVGESGRVYTVRWLVTGHWRHLEHARTRCTCCTPARAARWIDPYVKGPVGAPWKGRQVRLPGPPPETT